MKLQSTILLLSFLGLRVASAESGQSQGLAKAIAGLQKRYETVQSLSARFTQIYRAPGVEQVESGILFMKKPGMMRWQYQVPEVKLFVADGRKSYLYTPEDRQVMVREFTEADLRNTPLQILLGGADLQKTFEASWERELLPIGEATILLRLVPRSPQPEYEFVSLECDAKTLDIARIVIRELTGNSSEFIITDLKSNVKINKKQFQFKIPKGVEVIPIDDKS